MELQIENLKAQMRGDKLNIHQRADALIEFNRLVEYTETIEVKVKTLGLFSVSQRSELLLSAICQFTKRNTQKEIQEVEKWIETDFRK